MGPSLPTCFPSSPKSCLCAALLALAFASASVQPASAGARLTPPRSPLPSLPAPKKYEVWLVDQADSHGASKAYGGYIHIFGARALGEPSVLDLGAETAALCFNKTGSYPERPHMLMFNEAGSHASVAFVKTGHVAIIRAADRTPVYCTQASAGFNGLRQAHGAFPTRDNASIIITNQNGKKLERINVDWAKETFVHDHAATLPLYGDCKTPSGASCEDAALRPDNAPVCSVCVHTPSTLAFTSLRGGGMLVADYSTTPMALVGEYNASQVVGNGCNGMASDPNLGVMYFVGGGGLSTRPYGYQLIRLPATGYNPPLQPELTTVAKFTDAMRDAHGGGLIYAGQGASREVAFYWQVDRSRRTIDIYNHTAAQRVNAVPLVMEGVFLEPAPDLLVISPNQDFAFVSLRGPVPQTGDPHSSSGPVAALGVVRINRGGEAGRLVRVIPISNINGAGINVADAHGIDLRVF